MTPHCRKMAETWVHNGCCNFACEVYVAKQDLICTCQTSDPPPNPHPDTEKDSKLRRRAVRGFMTSPFSSGAFGCVWAARSCTDSLAPVRGRTSHIPHKQTHTHIHTCASLSNTYTPRLVKWLGRHDRDKSFISRWDNVLFIYLSF